MTTTTPPKPPAKANTPRATKSKADTVEPVLEHLALEMIDVADEFNARTSMDPEQLDELTASIRECGVKQPVIVERSGTRFTLVAGHRRLEASRRAERATIPALVCDVLDQHARSQIALVENLQREDLTPLDEARGYQRAIEQTGLTQQRLAKLTSKSQSHISQRLTLLKLPDACQQLLADGSVPVQAAKSLLAFTDVAPDIATCCARLVHEGVLEASELIDQPHVAIEVLAGHADDHPDQKLPFVHGIDWTGSVSFDGYLDPDRASAFDERIKALRLYGIRMTSEDADAARSYGCLLELMHQFGSHRFVTDPEWLHDRLTQYLDKLEAERAQRAAPQSGANATTTAPASPAAGTTDASSGKDAPATDDSSVSARLARMRAEQDQRRSGRDAERKVREDAIVANRQLGINLAKHLGAKKIDRATARMLAQIILRQNPTLAGGGIRYTHAEYHQLEHTRTKAGEPRIHFKPTEPRDAHTQLTDWILRASKPEEIIGRLLQALICGLFADEHAVAQSNRAPWHAPTFQTDIPETLTKLARKHLPEHFHNAAKRLLPNTPACDKPATAPMSDTDKAATTKQAKTASKAPKPAQTKSSARKAKSSSAAGAA